MILFKIVCKCLPHALIIIALMFITFLIIDSKNNAMEFINSDISKSLMLLWCIVSLITAVMLISFQRRNSRQNGTAEVRANDSSLILHILYLITCEKYGNQSSKQETGSDAELEETLQKALEELRKRR